MCEVLYRSSRVLTVYTQVSADMKALNKTFAKLHGVSSLANMTAFLSLLFHGLWIGNNGAGIKSIL